MKKTVFIKNAAWLTSANLILRVCGMIFKVKVASLVGAEGIGLYSIIFSFFVFVSAFCTSGVPTAVTMLCTKAQAKGQNPKIIIRKSLIISAAISIITAFLIFPFAGFLSKKLVSGALAVPSLKTLTVILPFMSACGVLRGYFLSRRNARINAVSQTIEQVCRIAAGITLVKLFLNFGTQYAVCALFVADAVAEAAATAYLFYKYKKYGKKEKGLHKADSGYQAIIRISLPLWGGRYIGSLLRTAENVFIPRLLNLYKSKSESALALFGKIKGMALPILLFPSGMMSAISLLLIPEIGEASALKRAGVVRCLTEDILRFCFLLSFYCAAAFFFFGKQIGMLLYGDFAVGEMLMKLSLIMPFVFIDSIADGMLKGLDKQNFCFIISICDSAIRLILLPLILPRLGVTGFIYIMYLSNAFTALLNLNKLIKTTKAKTDILKVLFLPFFASIVVCYFSNTVLCTFGITNGLVNIIPNIAISFTLYCVIIFLFGSVSVYEMRSFIKSGQ